MGQRRYYFKIRETETQKGEVNTYHHIVQNRQNRWVAQVAGTTAFSATLYYLFSYIRTKESVVPA